MTKAIIPLFSEKGKEQVEKRSMRDGAHSMFLWNVPFEPECGMKNKNNV